ncbi:MAG: alpha/beta hydrolase fold domain-containing protein [Byssovorax sp.]
MISKSGQGGETRLLHWLRRRAGALITDSAFRGMASAGRLHPQSDPARHRVEVTRDLPYGPPGAPGAALVPERRLDVYRPTDRGTSLPIVLYVHGGGFRILSKDTHWVMALAFARKGYLVFTIDYRLAPKHPYPAAVEDCCAALAWVVENAARFGGDLDRLVFAGESAGANLVTSLALTTSYPRPEPWARAAFDLGVTPKVVLPACGMLQVTDPGRFSRRDAKIPIFIQDRIAEVTHAYLGGAAAEAGEALELADPLILLEQQRSPDRPLPRFFIPVGTRDPLLDDSRRLKAALDRHGAVAEIEYYPGEVHAFHAFVWREHARRCWAHTFSFLERHMPPGDRP